MEAGLTPADAGGIGAARAFRSVDGYVLEAYRVAATEIRGEGRVLAAEIRSAAIECGAALVASGADAAEGGRHRPPGGAGLRRVRRRLYETRYRLYVARRLGWLERATYRRLVARHDAAVRDFEAWVAAGSRPDARTGPG